MGPTRLFFININPRYMTWKLLQEEQPYLRVAHHRYLNYIPLTQNKHKIMKGDISETKKREVTLIVTDTLPGPDTH